MSRQAHTFTGKKRFFWTAAASGVIILTSLLCERPAYGQFDLGVVIGMLESIQQILNSTITPIMKTMNTVEGDIKSFQQTVMYPVTEISKIESMASSFTSQMTSMQNLFKTPVNSATLSSTQSLETKLLGGNANNISGIGTSYYSVYGSLPTSTALTSDVRTVVDMNDTQAQDAYKTAVKLDAIATTEEQLSQQYMQQLQSTAPGNAALVQAQASAWNLQAAAYTQQALAELLRTEAADTAYQSFKTKHASTTHQQGLQGLGLSPSN